MSGLRAGSVAAVPAVLVAVLLGAAAPASAADRIGLSRDGEHWSSSLEGPLFDPALRWVPGDVWTTRFYVRNQAGSAGDAAIEVGRLRGSSLLDAGDLRVKARAGSGPWSDVVEGSDQELLSHDDIPVGAVVPVEIRARLPYGSPFNASMRLASAVDLRVVLSDARADGRTSRDGRGRGTDDDRAGDVDGTDGESTGTATDAATDASTTGSLPDTGTRVPAWTIPLGLVLSVLGGLVLAGRRGPRHSLVPLPPRSTP